VYVIVLLCSFRYVSSVFSQAQQSCRTRADSQSLKSPPVPFSEKSRNFEITLQKKIFELFIDGKVTFSG